MFYKYKNTDLIESDFCFREIFKIIKLIFKKAVFQFNYFEFDGTIFDFFKPKTTTIFLQINKSQNRKIPLFYIFYKLVIF